MDQLIEAIKSNDFVKTKRIFNEAMKPIVASVLEEQKIALAKSIMIEGESKKEDDDEDQEDDEDDEDED
ncbi:gp67 prohead core [Acinetobacter phage Ac42]|uniref:prohead n=1 Tax=Acinetobacter phage Ac42 TaxID=762660 RepID=UPI0001EBCDAE|nr:prohead [Acinetobacter phage Ac42]ADI96418.1 gp67 prohead core [Acinetobacter phage Ac42]